MTTRIASRHTRDTVQLVSMFVGVVLIVGILYAGGVADVVVIAALLAYILDPLVTFIEARGLSRSTATTALMLVLVACGVAFWWTVVPMVVNQLHAFESVSASATAVRTMERVQDFIRTRFAFIGLGDFDLSAELGRMKTGVIERIPELVLQTSLSFVIGAVMTPLLMYFFLKDGRQMKKYFISLVPNRYFEFSLDLLYKMDTQLGNYLRGQFLDAAIFGMLATGVLWALGVPYFIFIGAFAGLANLIPFVGPFVGACTGFGAVMFEEGDIVRGIYVLIAFAILKLIDDTVIQPLAVGRTVKLHPAAVAVGIVAGGKLFGVIGMLLVVPMMGFVKVFFEESIETYRRYRFD